MRTRITVEDVAADPTNAYEVTVHGDAAIAELTIHGDEGGHGWVYVKYASGGSSAGCPKHWASYVRITEDEDTTAEFYPAGDGPTDEELQREEIRQAVRERVITFPVFATAPFVAVSTAVTSELWASLPDRFPVLARAIRPVIR